jgi:putative sigma-54 modulation protein
MSKESLQNNSAYNITITGRHLQVTEAMKQYAIDRISKIERFSHRTIDVAVTMDVHKFQHHVTIILRFDHIKIKAEATTEDMYISIDVATQRIESQLKKYRDKLQNHHARALSVIDMTVNVLRPATLFSEVDEFNEQIEQENKLRAEKTVKVHEVVKQETRPLKVLSDDEAIMKMELSGDQFMIYRCEHNRMIKVIYRREDGHYGVIETQ